MVEIWFSDHGGIVKEGLDEELIKGFDSWGYFNLCSVMITYMGVELVFLEEIAMGLSIGSPEEAGGWEIH